jgi:predicted dehydrogenase
MAKHFPFASHAQVLAAHADIEWGAVVDPSDEALASVKRTWNVPRAGHTIQATCAGWEPELAVLATPPMERLRAIEAMPSLRAVLVEKPLGGTLEESQAFVAACKARGLLVQVNLWHRSDDRFRELAGSLESLIGKTQAVFGVYGNGLRNNGSHMIDFSRILFGEIARVAAVPSSLGPAHGPIPGDIHVSFRLEHASGVTAYFSALDFREYRENGLDIWGTTGRLSIMQEGLYIARFPKTANRQLSGSNEVASDAPEIISSTCGMAFYRMYDNLVAALRGQAELVSTAVSAMRNEGALQAVWRSAHGDGQVLVPDVVA